MSGVRAGAEGDTELVIQDKNPCVININGQYITPNAAQTVKNFSKLLPHTSAHTAAGANPAQIVQIKSRGQVWSALAGDGVIKKLFIFRE